MQKKVSEKNLLKSAGRLKDLSPELDRQIDKILSNTSIPGAAIAVVQGGQSFTKAYGVIRGGSTTPVTPETAFDLGSCSKNYVATAIAALVSDGKLNFDDPIKMYLPEIELDQPWITEQITIRDLLSNRTGLKRQVPLESFADLKISASEVMRRIGKLDRLHPFRGGYVYFNPGFMANRLVVERVSGMSYGEFLNQRLFSPMGLHHTASGSALVNLIEERATGHTMNKGAPYPIEEPPFDNWQGAAGIFSSAEDSCHWLHFMLNHGKINNNQLIDSAILAETHKPHTVMPKAECLLIHCPPEAHLTAYCMGWWTTDLNGERLVQHAGEMFGWRAQTALLPDEKIGVTVMLSMAAPRHQTLAYTILETLQSGQSRDWCSVTDKLRASQISALAGLIENSFPCPYDVHTMLPLEKYAGTYNHPALGNIEVVEIKEGLKIHVCDGPIWDMSLCPIGDHVFSSSFINPAVRDFVPVPMRVRFTIGNGRVNGLQDMSAKYKRKF